MLPHEGRRVRLHARRPGERGHGLLVDWHEAERRAVRRHREHAGSAKIREVAGREDDGATPRGPRRREADRRGGSRVLVGCVRDDDRQHAGA